MRRLLLVMFVGMLAAGIGLYAQDNTQENTVECPDGTTYANSIWLSAPPNVGSPLLPPDAPPDTAMPYFLTVMSLRETKPILFVKGDNALQACAPIDPRAATYSANLPSTGEVAAAPLNTGFIVPPQTGSIEIALANAEEAYGEFLLFIEGVSSVASDADGDVYTLPITPAMIASGVPLTAYVIALDEAYDAALALVDADGRVLRDEANQAITCDNAGDAETCYGESVSLENTFIAGFRNQRFGGKATDAMLTLPLTDALLATGVSLRVNTGATSGEYALLLHLASGAPTDTTVAATLATAADGTLTVTCANGMTINAGVRFEVPSMKSETVYRVTAIGSGDYDPALAVFQADDSGVCYDDSDVTTYSALLPDGNYIASNRTAQAALATNSAYIIVGSTSQPPAGSVAVIIEGFAYTASAEVTETPVPLLNPTEQLATAQAGATQTIAAGQSAMTQTAVAGQIFLTQTAIAAQPEATLPPDAILASPTINGDTFVVQVSPGMAARESNLFVYMLAVERTLNPFLAWVDDTNTIRRDDMGQLVLCNDAGVPWQCHAELPSLAGYQLTVTDNQILPGFTPDAALRLIIGEDDAGNMVRLIATTPDNSTGAYVLVMTLTTR